MASDIEISQVGKGARAMHIQSPVILVRQDRSWTLVTRDATDAQVTRTLGRGRRALRITPLTDNAQVLVMHFTRVIPDKLKTAESMRVLMSRTHVAYDVPLKGRK